METTEKARPKRPVEVQQARAGAVRILRRGLHGAKDWVLEPDTDGLPRGPLAKLARALVLLTPVWIVLSAATGGPERGQQQASVPQAVLLALLVTLAGLGLLSAWERRQGREEPWIDAAELITEGDTPAGREESERSGEEPTRVLEKPQVSEVCKAGEPRNGADIHPIGGEAEQSAPISLRKPDIQATTESVNGSARPGEFGACNTAGEALHQATPEGMNGEESDDLQHSGATPQHSAPTRVLPTLRNTSPEPENPQVSPEIPVLREEVRQAGEPPLTESDATPQRPTPSEVLQGALREIPPPPPSSQVSPEVAGLQESLRGVLREDWATPGPYPAEEEPVAEDWFATPPDPASAPEVEEPAEKVPVPEVDEEPDVSPDEVAGAGLADLPRPVQEYLLTRTPTALPEERKAALGHVVRWAREEVRAGSLSRADIARLTRVRPSTVTRWLARNDDPWAD